MRLQAMGLFVKLVDESASGEVLREVELEIPFERTSVRALIERRVRHEVERSRRIAAENLFPGIAEPICASPRTWEELWIDGQVIDVEAQVERAWNAFERNGFFVLVGERQVESLDEEVLLFPGLQISFVKLIHLVGG
ncbi:MAG: hypothetical protein AAGA56_13280 [Myxococcota bacterium]